MGDAADPDPITDPEWRRLLLRLLSGVCHIRIIPLVLVATARWHHLGYFYDKSIRGIKAEGYLFAGRGEPPAGFHSIL